MPEREAQWGYGGDNQATCGRCWAVVRHVNKEKHEEWHQENDRVMVSFVADRLREMETELELLRQAGEPDHA